MSNLEDEALFWYKQLIIVEMNLEKNTPFEMYFCISGFLTLLIQPAT